LTVQSVPKRRSPLRQLRAIAVLPGTVTIVIPALLVWFGGADVDLRSAVIGAVLSASGLALVSWTIQLFVSVGRGTLAPWDPTSRLVVRGPYRHVRNPMITGVALIVAGEAVFFRSLGIAILLAVFLTINAISFPLVEEPGLSRRFGPDYDEYRAHVPRWVPRARPWRR
jgi:protein-S-isoprenylcysteine O-methyltransferase Ste14